MRCHYSTCVTQLRCRIVPSGGTPSRGDDDDSRHFDDVVAVVLLLRQSILPPGVGVHADDVFLAVFARRGDIGFSRGHSGLLVGCADHEVIVAALILPVLRAAARAVPFVRPVVLAVLGTDDERGGELGGREGGVGGFGGVHAGIVSGGVPMSRAIPGSRPVSSAIDSRPPTGTIPSVDFGYPRR